MGQYKIEAILLAVRDWDDADRMVTLFSREYGKLTAVAYGARRPRNQLSGAVQPFVYAELALASGKSLPSIKQCEVKNTFRPLREDLTTMAYATFLAELASELWPEREAEPAVFDLLLSAFDLMSSRNPRITALTCALQMMALGGFRPECGRCVVCGEPITSPAYFDPRAGGSVCTGCAEPKLAELSGDVSSFIDRLLTLNLREPGHFTVVGAVLMQTEKLITDFITCRLDRPLKSMAFIAAVTSPDKKPSPWVK